MKTDALAICKQAIAASLEMTGSRALEPGTSQMLRNL